MSDWVIEARGLKKSFQGRQALAGLDLDVPKGSIFGFLGKNGAGKTTTIRLLLGLLRPDAGALRVFRMAAEDLSAGIGIRSRLGFVSEDKGLYPYMTVEQIIRFTRSFFPKWRSDLEERYLEMFALRTKQKIPDLSKGMRSKLALLLAISRGAELLILDEPTEGLDAVAVEEMLRELVSISAAEGTTIFFSSHQLEEVEQISDRVCIIDQGAAVLSGVLDDLKTHFQRLRVVLGEELTAPVHWGAGVERVRQDGRTVEILASRNVEAIVAQAQSLPGASVERFPVSLKEIFLEKLRSN